MANSQFTTRLIANVIFGVKRKELRNPKIKFLVFTGTVGKTTLRDAVVFGLKKQGYRVESNDLGYSNEVGVLLTTLGIERFSVINFRHWLKVLRAQINEEKFVCVELGADFYRDIPWFLRRFTPTAVFISGVSEEDWVVKAENVTNDRKKLLDSVPKSGFIIYNIDDPPTKRLVERSNISAHKITFSLENQDATLYAKSWSKNIFSLPLREALNKKELIEIIYSDRPYTIFSSKPLFEPQIYAIFAALSFIATINGKRISEGIFDEYKFAPQRLQFSRAKNGAVILEDSYKATPLCTFWFLKAAANTQAQKKILFITEMRPLTLNQNFFYEQLADLVRFAEKVYFLGPAEHWRQIASINKGFLHINVAEYSAVAKRVLQETDKNSLILLKGSFRYHLDYLKQLLS